MEKQMRRITKVLSLLVVGGSLSLFAAPAHADWGFQQNDGFWSNGDGPPGHDKEDKDKGDKDNSGPSSNAVPEIDPAGVGSLVALVGGGIALVTARRRKTVA
jgi:hypothetical protein